ncbi:MAG: hypothetical protein LC623_07515, partial [Halobacteriales archaeon]|nr:hypothetical protein [Halobacteriales archaeon]
VHLLDDNAADVKIDLAGNDQDPAGRWAAADLKALDVRETLDQVTFVLTVGSLSSNAEAPFAEDVRYTIGFRHLDQVYRVTLDRRVLYGPAQAFGSVSAYNPATQEYEQVSPSMQVAQDLAAGTLTFSADRDLLVDREGDTPHPEVPLTDWQATSGGLLSGIRFGSFCPTRTNCLPNPFPSAHDAMPDSGNGTLALTPRFGVAQSGHARLFSQVPTRASNGEATTIVYQVQAVNRGDGNETFSLAASGVPAGWLVRLPATRITVPANGTVQLPVLASVPFTHEHGTYQKFVVEMQSLSDARSTGRIQLGIRYSNPPQPAGHHNALWLHARSEPQVTGNADLDRLLYGPSGLYMNALSNDPLDAHLDLPANNCGSDLTPPQTHFCWSIPLQPQLELGLDFDLQRAGTLTVPIQTTLPLLGARLEGSLAYIAQRDDAELDGVRFRGYEATAVATVLPRPPVDVPPNSEGNLLTADLVPTPEGDYLPYQKGAQLFLQLELVATGQQLFGGFLGDVSSPSIQPGGTLSDLPLNEYHDIVAQVFSSNSTLQLLADGPQDRATNPGKTLLFNLTLQNDGPAGTFNLELTGTHLPWARIVAPGDQVRLGAGESVPVRIAVQVPGTADKGDTADLVLAATSAANLNIRSLARLFATVDTAKQYTDESPLLEQAKAAAKGTPGVEALLLAPCLLALAAVARRRL